MFVLPFLHKQSVRQSIKISLRWQANFLRLPISQPHNSLSAKRESVNDILQVLCSRMYRKRSYKYGTPFLDIILTVENAADTEYGTL